MASEDRPIDRKAETPGVEHEPETDGGEDLRPDLDHFDTFRDHASGFRDRLPDLRVPNIPVVAGVMATLYVSVVAGALSVAYGATSLAAAHGGTHTALIVAGVFAFVYGYVGLRLIDTATRESNT